MPIRLEDLLASFQRHLRAAHKAPRTVELYSQSVRYFVRWLAERDRPATLEELTRHAISAWLAELAENSQASTVATRLRGMRRFCRWLVVEGELDKAPTEGIEIAVATDKPVPVLSDAEITALLKTCAGRPGPSGDVRSPDIPGTARRGDLQAAAGHRRSGLRAVRAEARGRRPGPGAGLRRRQGLPAPGGALRRQDRPGDRPLPADPGAARAGQLT